VRTLRNPWIVALVLGGAALGLIGALALSELYVLPLLAGLAVGAGLVTLRVRREERRRQRGRRRSSSTSPRARPITHGYDLREDRTTDSQRWIM
jgi:hypothetical protein